jgi:hypothetical protein
MRTCKYTVVSEHDGGSSRIETSDYDAYETAAVYTEEDMESASLTAYQKGVSDGSW